MHEFFVINSQSRTAKYKQLSNSILEGIRAGKIPSDVLLPSINELSIRLDISRDSIVKCYQYLKENGTIGSIPGKGYFVKDIGHPERLRIAFFLNKLSVQKKIVFDAFSKEIGEQAFIDLFVYDSNIYHLKNILDKLSNNYDRIILFPHFKEGRERSKEIIGNIAPDKLILLGSLIEDIPAGFSAIYENHEEDIFNVLDQHFTDLQRYKSLSLIFPDHSDYPKAIIKGFYRFCDLHNITHRLVGALQDIKIRKGECYINIAENDLIALLDKIHLQQLKLGTDVGVISYNETPLKKFIMNGISTMSTDFSLMGITAAKLTKSKTIDQVQMPFKMIKRNSF